MLVCEVNALREVSMSSMSVWQSVPDLLPGVRDSFSEKVLMTLNFESKMTIRKRHSVRGYYRQTTKVGMRKACWIIDGETIAQGGKDEEQPSVLVTVLLL